MWHKCWLLAMILAVVMAFSACSGCQTTDIVEPSSEALVETEQDKSSQEKETEIVIVVEVKSESDDDGEVIAEDRGETEEPVSEEYAEEDSDRKTEQSSEIPAENESVVVAASSKEPETTKLPEIQPATKPIASQPATKPTEAQPTVQPTEASSPETTAAPHVHSYTGEVTKQPTCQETGVKTYTCSCGDTYTETIPKTDHHYVGKKEETTKTVTDSEAFSVEVACCIPRYCASYTHNEDGSWDFLGTWQDTIQYGVPQQQYFYAVHANYVMPNGHNTGEVLAYLRNAGYPYIYEDMSAAADACDRWLRCIGEFSNGPKNPDHGFRDHYGPNWWESSVPVTVPAVTHQETVTNTYYECSECGHRK